MFFIFLFYLILYLLNYLCLLLHPPPHFLPYLHFIIFIFLFLFTFLFILFLKLLFSILLYLLLYILLNRYHLLFFIYVLKSLFSFYVLYLHLHLLIPQRITGLNRQMIRYVHSFLLSVKTAVICKPSLAIMHIRSRLLCRLARMAEHWLAISKKPVKYVRSFWKYEGKWDEYKRGRNMKKRG